LISFEKVAELNNFPPDKYAAILQAHLTGKALKVFTELSVEECRDYPTLKAALLQAYSVVPEVYRKRFWNLSKLYTETYSEYAFRLSTHEFTRWLESEGAYSDVELLRDLMQREQFQSNLDSELRVWLIDQKPKNLSKVARLADQYVAVWKADRPVYKGHGSPSKGHVTKPKTFGASGHSNSSGAFRNQLRLVTILSLTLSRSPQPLQLETNSPPSVIETRHLEYVSTVRNMATSCLRVPRGVLSVSKRGSGAFSFYLVLSGDSRSSE